MTVEELREEDILSPDDAIFHMLTHGTICSNGCRHGLTVEEANAFTDLIRARDLIAYRCDGQIRWAVSRRGDRRLLELWGPRGGE